jgi:hypothetical protein
MTTEIDPNRWYWVLVETRNLPWAATSSATYEHEFGFKGRLLNQQEKELLFHTEGGVLYYFQYSSITVTAVSSLLFIDGGCAIRGNTLEQLAAELKEEGLESVLLATLLEEEGEPA